MTCKRSIIKTFLSALFKKNERHQSQVHIHYFALNSQQQNLIKNFMLCNGHELSPYTAHSFLIHILLELQGVTLSRKNNTWSMVTDVTTKPCSRVWAYIFTSCGLVNLIIRINAVRCPPCGLM